MREVAVAEQRLDDVLLAPLLLKRTAATSTVSAPTAPTASCTGVATAQTPITYSSWS